MKPLHVFLLVVFIGLFLYVTLTGDKTSGSSFSPKPDGTMAFYETLARLKQPVRHWLYPFDQLPPKKGETMIVVSPEKIGGAEKLLAWVTSGNKAVIFSRNPVFLGSLGLVAHPVQKEHSETKAEAEEVPPPPFFDLRSEESRAISCSHPACEGVQRISALRCLGKLKADPGAEIILEEHGESCLIRKTAGAGELWLFADAQPVLNEALDSFDNFRFLYQIVVTDPAKAIYFDEFHHGFVAPTAAGARRRQQNIYLFCGVLLFVLTAAVLTAAVRLGPPLPEPAQPAAHTVEYPIAFGLLCREHRVQEILRYYYRNWRKRVERRVGLSEKLGEPLLLQEFQRTMSMSEERKSELEKAVRLLSIAEDANDKLMAEAVRCVEKILEKRSNA